MRHDENDGTMKPGPYLAVAQHSHGHRQLGTGSSHAMEEQVVQSISSIPLGLCGLC